MVKILIDTDGGGMPRIVADGTECVPSPSMLARAITHIISLHNYTKEMPDAADRCPGCVYCEHATRFLDSIDAQLDKESAIAAAREFGQPAPKDH